MAASMLVPGKERQRKQGVRWGRAEAKDVNKRSQQQVIERAPLATYLPLFLLFLVMLVRMKGLKLTCTAAMELI